MRLLDVFLAAVFAGYLAWVAVLIAVMALEALYAPFVAAIVLFLALSLPVLLHEARLVTPELLLLGVRYVVPVVVLLAAAIIAATARTPFAGTVVAAAIAPSCCTLLHRALHVASATDVVATRQEVRPPEFYTRLYTAAGCVVAVVAVIVDAALALPEGDMPADADRFATVGRLNTLVHAVLAAAVMVGTQAIHDTDAAVEREALQTVVALCSRGQLDEAGTALGDWPPQASPVLYEVAAEVLQCVAQHDDEGGAANGIAGSIGGETGTSGGTTTSDGQHVGGANDNVAAVCLYIPATASTMDAARLALVLAQVQRAVAAAQGYVCAQEVVSGDAFLYAVWGHSRGPEPALNAARAVTTIIRSHGHVVACGGIAYGPTDHVPTSHGRALGCRLTGRIFAVAQALALWGAHGSSSGGGGPAPVVLDCDAAAVLGTYLPSRPDEVLAVPLGASGHSLHVAFRPTAPLGPEDAVAVPAPGQGSVARWMGEVQQPDGLHADVLFAAIRCVQARDRATALAHLEHYCAALCPSDTTAPRWAARLRGDGPLRAKVMRYTACTVPVGSTEGTAAQAPTSTSTTAFAAAAPTTTTNRNVAPPQ